MSANKVLETTRRIIENPKYVFIDAEKVDSVARRFAESRLEIPSWNEPVFVEGCNGKTIDFFMLGNSINFYYMDISSRKKFAVEHGGIPWSGSMGMWISLKKAVDSNIPILEGEYLSKISMEDMKKIFSGNIEIPMLQERLEIFREVGKVLTERYNGHFYNIFRAAGGRLFNNRNGLVELLVAEFPSFNDSIMYQGGLVRFDKRAQLGPGMLYGRFRGDGKHIFEDIDELTVFPNYTLPKGLRDMGILRYEESLAKRVDSQLPIEAGSQEELEIRASTIHAAKMLQDIINQHRTEKVNALHLDYKLWAESRGKTGTPHHLTKTIAY